MSSIKKTSDVRTVEFSVQGQQPLSFYGGKPFDPQTVVLVIENGEVDNAAVYGIHYKTDGKLGRAKAQGFFHKENSPAWLAKLVTDEGARWSA